MELLREMKTTMYAYEVMKKHIRAGVNKTIKVGEDTIEFITDDTNIIMYACYCHCSGRTRSVYNIYTGYSKWNPAVLDLPIDFALYFTDEDYRFQIDCNYSLLELEYHGCRTLFNKVLNTISMIYFQTYGNNEIIGRQNRLHRYKCLDWGA